MCNLSAGKTGSCFPDEKTASLQYVFRIPLPHWGCQPSSVRRSGFRNCRILQKEGIFYVTVSPPLFPRLLE